MKGLNFFLSLVHLASLVSAAAIVPDFNATTRVTCVTAYGNVSVVEPAATTISRTYGSTWTRTSIVTPLTTITPVADSTTITSSTTSTLTSTASTPTDTTTLTVSLTTVLTSSTVTTLTTTIVVASTVTTTTSSGTTTVGTVTGFTPVASLDSVIRGGGGRQVAAKRDVGESGKPCTKKKTTSSSSSSRRTTTSSSSTRCTKNDLTSTQAATTSSSSLSSKTLVTTSLTTKCTKTQTKAIEITSVTSSRLAVTTTSTKCTKGHTSSSVVPVSSIKTIRVSSNSVRAASASSILVSSARPSQQQYATAVTCYQNVDLATYLTMTITAVQTSTITAPIPPMSTFTTDTTLFETTTITPAATTATASVSVTSTMITTNTATSTAFTTTISTTTVTSLVPVATTYAACQSNNLINGVGQYPINIVYSSGNAVLVSAPQANSLAACCNACQASTTTCSGFTWRPPQTGAVPGQCSLLQNRAGSCLPRIAFWDAYHINGFDDSQAITVGDGPCGQGEFAGVFFAGSK